MASLSRQLAQWVAALRYDDLPPEVVDRAKGVTLHGLASVLLGSLTPGGRQAVKLMSEEEAGVKNGATVMVDGARVTKGGAAFANAEMAMAGGKSDTFRRLTHPGTSIIPGAFVAAETASASGRDFLTGLAAGYEVMERMAADFIPTVMARGFHSGVVFGIFGPAVAAAKIMGFTEDQANSTIALCASLAAGNREGARSGGGELARDAVSEPRISEPSRRSGVQAGQHGVLRRLRRGEARLPRAEGAGRSGRRRRPARGARSDEARDLDPLPHDDALWSADHDLHPGRQELHQAVHRPRVHLDLRRRDAEDSRCDPRAADSGGAVRGDHCDLPRSRPPGPSRPARSAHLEEGLRENRGCRGKCAGS